MQGISRTLDTVQLRLATGKRVNSALDNPANFFNAQSLTNRAHDLERLLDGINQSIRTTEEALHGVDAIQKVLDTAESFLKEYRHDFITGEVDLTDILDTSFFLPMNNVADFTNYAGGQDSGVPVTLIENGFGVRLDDNSWRRFAVGANITASTILEFDFRSENIPEIAAIGFDNDTNFGNGNTQFFLYGQQTTGVTYAAPTPTFEYDGSGEWVHVTIPVGTYFTGNFSHLTFFDDDDGGGDDGDAQFRNIVIHNGEYTFGQTNTTVADIYEQEYAGILEQIDYLTEDSHYRGINLLKDEDLITDFNEDRSNKLVTEGMDATSLGLGLEYEDFTSLEQIDRKLAQVREARESLRRFGSSLSVDFGIINGRRDFTEETINHLKAGSDDLILSDQNKDGAELLALQTRQIIQASTLALNTISIADFLI